MVVYEFEVSAVAIKYWLLPQHLVSEISLSSRRCTCYCCVETVPLAILVFLPSGESLAYLSRHLPTFFYRPFQFYRGIIHSGYELIDLCAQVSTEKHPVRSCPLPLLVDSNLVPFCGSTWPRTHTPRQSCAQLREYFLKPPADPFDCTLRARMIVRSVAQRHFQPPPKVFHHHSQEPATSRRVPQEFLIVEQVALLFFRALFPTLFV